VTDFLEEKRREIAARLNELEPLVEEYNRLAAAAAALGEIGGRSAAPAKKRGRPAGRKKVGRPKAKKVGLPPGFTLAGEAPTARAAPATGHRRTGRRRGSGPRAAQVLAIVQEQPGITIPELATLIGIRQNYLYRVLPALEREGEVRRVRVEDAHRTAGRGPSGWVPQREEWCSLCGGTHRPGKHRE
jgi:hypothetical protein